MPYCRNTALLHTDTSLLPRPPRRPGVLELPPPRATATGPVTVTYDLTRLQRLATDTHYLVTLGGEDLVDPATVIDRMEYEHPLYTPARSPPRRRLPEINTDADRLRRRLPRLGLPRGRRALGSAAADQARPRLARSATPTRRPTTWPRVASRPRSATPGAGRSGAPSRTARTFWLVDLDDLPDHGVLGRFEARDHLGAPDATLRANVEAFLADHGVDAATGGQILMAAHPRSLGHCFNPISVFWCFDDAGRPAGVVVEVHNTYGDRHAYLVHPDEQGRARTDKALYVSPFHGTDGTYELAVPVPTDRLDIAVTLHTDDGARRSARASSGTSSRPSPLRQTASAALCAAAR